MKKRLSYLFILLCLLLVAACKNAPADSAVADTDEGAGGCEGEKAKAILWVDYKKGTKLANYTKIRTVKVFADVNTDGTLKVLSFCKKQPMKVENYILKKVEVYRIRKEVFEDKYLEPGEQYLQLRYIPDWMK